MKFVRRHPILVVLGLLALLLIVLLLLALPLRTVPGDANAAKSELTQAVEALKAGDDQVAFQHIDTARERVDEVTGATGSFGATVWSNIPVAGSAVRDVRALAGAMDELTSAAEVAKKVYPDVAGEDGRLMNDGAVDLDVLASLIASLDEIEGHIVSADEELDRVEGSAPFVGGMVGDARNEARAQVTPARDSLEDLGPVIRSLPAILGKDEEKKYLVAMMNPSEMKYSGGSMLTFSVMTLDEGVIERGKTLDAAQSPQVFRPAFWENVEGNPFASAYSERITHANTAPSWPVAGEETLRAWKWLRKREVDGLIAIDVVAISRILQVTGPITVEGLGEVGHENVVQLTTGDYSRFSEAEQEQRKELNRRLIPLFMERVLSGGNFLGTIQAVRASAAERHMALYFRDEGLQNTMASFGLDGDLSATDHDYVGFFTQNMIGSKADYGQQKKIRSTVRLAEDGSAEVELKATVVNTNLPAVGPIDAYTNPDITARLGLFLPRGVEVTSLKVTDVNGKRSGDTGTGDYFGRPYLQEQAKIPAGATAQLSARYTVPAAAVVDGKHLEYRLDLDPHPTVSDARVELTLVAPPGYTVTAPPAELGWAQTEKGNWRWVTEAMATRTSIAVHSQRN